MLPVKVVDVVMKEKTGGTMPPHTLYRIVLMHEESRRALVIWIGETEAMMIVMKLNHYETPRPMTQMLIARLLAASDAKVDYVVIYELKSDVFYATVHLKTQSGSKEIDARPSDAVALALYADSPIYVNAPVMAEAGMDVPEGKQPVGGGLKEINTKTADRTQQFQEHNAPIEQKSAEQLAAELQAETDEFLAKVFG